MVIITLNFKLVMKRTFLFLAIIFCLTSCENKEQDFPDFDYISGFFPYQYPVRTIILGDYIYDNTNDINHMFLISAAIGGVYTNDKDRTFNIEVDESLTNNALFSSSLDTIRLMPSNYYNLESNKITIPKGKYNGGIKVQLTDDFFKDTLSVITTYVIPVRITNSNDVDTILRGKTSMMDADPRITGHWEITPKDFTMFAVKFINEYHGNYFYYGSSQLKTLDGTIIENNQYQEKYIEKNPITFLKTIGRNQVSLNIDTKSTYIDGNVEMTLDFDGNNCTIHGKNQLGYFVTGNGEFKKEQFIWGNKLRDGIVINYKITNNTYSYHGQDTLVVRDRDVILETFEPLIRY